MSDIFGADDTKIQGAIGILDARDFFHPYVLVDVHHIFICDVRTDGLNCFEDARAQDI